MLDDGEALDKEVAKGGATRPADPATKGKPREGKGVRARGG